MAPPGSNGGIQATSSSNAGTIGRSSFLDRFVYRPLFGWLGFIFRLTLWPLRRIGDVLLPLGEYEGFSPTATEGASKQFVSYLKKALSLNSDTSDDIVKLFSSNSYSDVQREAASSDALILVYLQSPYHRSNDDVCRRLLCSPSMVRFLAENRERVKAIGSSTATSQGAMLSYSLSVSSFPALALLQPEKSSNSSNSSSNNNNNNSGAKNDSGETDGEATTLSQVKLVDATKDSINYGDPYPELQICPQKKQQQQQSDVDTIGDGPLQRSSAMSFQLDIPLHHIQRVESESTLMIVIYTKDVHAIDEKKAGTEKEAARLAFQSSDDRDAACLDLKVLVEWNKHRQPEIEEELPADGIRNRAQKAAHFAKREIEMREKKRDRERRKAGHMSNMASGGLKYTAMAMANQSVT
mmetsp:Transcript_32856/g.77558  ORF Transcript_32856/g.77558 Transcript_32856/m.77558 type:complete len:410 (+) Transcript_32856:168-1397(+)